MKDEMKKILQMVEEHKITVGEAEKLLEALEVSEYDESSAERETISLQDKFLHVRVTENGEQKVQVNLPLSLIEVGLKIGGKVGPQFVSEMKGLENINFNELIEAVRNGANGKLVEVDDGNNHVEVYVD